VWAVNLRGLWCYRGKGAPVGRWSDMDVGTFLLMVGLSYGLGLLWYDLLPGKLPEQVWRVAGYPMPIPNHSYGSSRRMRSSTVSLALL
jgi:hypothetical protein